MPHPNSLKNLRPIKPGEVRNPEGKNGWTKYRDIAREELAGEDGEDIRRMIRALKVEANNGDVQALRVALGPLLNIMQQEIGDPEGGPVTFRWKRSEDEEPGEK